MGSGSAERDELISRTGRTLSSVTAWNTGQPFILDFGGQNSIPQRLFWVSVSIAFLIANIPPPLVTAVCAKLMQLSGYETRLGGVQKLYQTAETIATTALFPLEELLFLACVLVMSYPLVGCLSGAKEILRTLDVRRIVGVTISLTIGLSVLVFPYSYPVGLNSHPSGLSGLGPGFAHMSAAPFQELNPLLHKRMLKPALAHFMHLHGYIAYYVFSLLLTLVLIFLIVAFIETRFPSSGTAGRDQPLMYPGIRWLGYLSLFTSSFVMVDFQWPGYSDSLSYILMLLIVLLPMSPQCRLAAVALCVLNHEGVALALIPLILFAFPREERLRSVLPIGIFYGIMVGSYGFSLMNWFQAQGSVLTSGSVWATMSEEPGLFLAGLFFTYKVFWLLLVPITFMLWRTKNRPILVVLVAMTLFPVALTTFGWDTTRVTGFGWLGMVIAFGLFFRESHRFPRMYQYSVIALICINLLIPSYNVVTFYRDSLSAYPYRGLYSINDSLFRQIGQ